MQIATILFSVGFSLFLWMYLLTYFMHIGAQKDFFLRARWAVFRGACIAWVILIIHIYFSGLFSQLQWFLIPIIFFLGALPYLWKRWRVISFIPLIFAVITYGIIYAWIIHNDILLQFIVKTFQTPFYEEIGKWFQALVYAYPAVMSPFVAIGFWFSENIVYFTSEFTWSQFLGRTLFSLPMHLFAWFFWFWCLFTIRPSWLGMLVGICAAISLHALYNWSLTFSLILTLIIMMSGYIFYGWSLEDGWWKKSHNKISE